MNHIQIYSSEVAWNITSFTSIKMSNVQSDELNIAIDGEWDSRNNRKLCLTICTEDGRDIIVLDDSQEMPEGIKARIEKHCQSKKYELYWKNLNDDNYSPEQDFFCETSLRITMFFSPTDLILFIGWDTLKDLIQNHTISQKRCIITSKVCDFQVEDISGWTNLSLVNFAASQGVILEDKSKMDDYKDRMTDGLLEYPEEFIDYAFGDTRPLFEIRDNFINNIENIAINIWKIPQDKIQIKPSLGGLIGGLFAAYIENLSNRPEYSWALQKLGTLNRDHVNYQKNLKKFQEALKTNKIPELDKYDFDNLVYGESSIPHLAKQIDTSACFLALVQGGRCNNENPYRYSLDYALDIDVQGAYATALTKLTYPLGLPRIEEYRPNQQPLTLDEILKKLNHQSENWMILVEGELSFSQDLLYSKLSSKKRYY